jgi:catechol 2,3-dioxygenase-like lactoylglutathione lyase family enzyme
MKQRAGDAWMPADEYGPTLRGLTVNLLVEDIDKALVFQREVLAATVVYSDPDFAVLRGYGAEWMLHADHAYDRHPVRIAAYAAGQRGAGAELRLHGCDPDKAEAAAIACGFEVMASASNKPHGLRESFLVDADGYVWVPDVAV